MKILHLLASNRFSGAENVVCQIIGMTKDCNNLEMLYCSPSGEIDSALEERGIKFLPIDKLSVREVKRVISETSPDIIHAHDMRASFIAARACGKIKLISHIHNNAFDSRDISLKSLAYMLAAKKASHIFWVSDSSFEGYRFHSLFRKKSEVLYNIIDMEALYKKMKTDTAVYDYDVVYLGRLTYQKDPQRLIKVFDKVLKAVPNCRFAIIGTGELESECKALCKALGIENNVHFLGFMSNPLSLLYQSKVMVMTSRWEGTPMCALEALSLGVPIVSTPVDGLRVLIDDGENGYMSNEDDVLAQYIFNLISNSDMQNKFSLAALQKAEQINDKETYKSRIMIQYKGENDENNCNIDSGIQ